MQCSKCVIDLINPFADLVITRNLHMDEDVQMNGDEPQRSVMSVNRRL